MTYALREARFLPAHALAAAIAPAIALLALAVPGLYDHPFHDPFHARRRPCVEGIREDGPTDHVADAEANLTDAPA